MATSTTHTSTAAGVPVGALLCKKRHAQTVIAALDERQWRKKRTKVQPHEDDCLAVAVVPAAAAALDSSTDIPSKLARLLDDGEVRWASGMRVASQAAVAPAAPAAAAGAAAFTFAELFAGIGGFRLGLEPLGGRCVFASEIDPHACATYERNFGEAPSGDITEIPSEALPPCDIVTGGFPCQSFSRSGAQGGLADARGTLFYDVVRVATACNAKALMLENVPNLLRVDNGHALHIIAGALTAAGYHVRIQLLNAAAVAPQHRERVFIVGFRSDLRAAADAFRWPTFADAAAPPPLRAALEDVAAEALPRYRLSDRQWALVRATREYQKEPQWRLAQLGGTARTLRGSYRKSFSRFSEFVPLTAAGATESAAPEAAAASADEADGGEEAAEAEAEGEGEAEGEPEAVATTAAEAAPPAPRFYTERECARLQGFPDSFDVDFEVPRSLRGAGKGRGGGRLYLQLGNAVCPGVVQQVGAEILRALEVGAGGGDPAAPPAAACGCERFLSPSAINLLRGVTPPLAPPPPGAPLPAEYGRYGAEEPAERLSRVVARPPDALFCMECVATYRLEAG